MWDKVWQAAFCLTRWVASRKNPVALRSTGSPSVTPDPITVPTPEPTTVAPIPSPIVIPTPANPYSLVANNTRLCGPNVSYRPSPNHGGVFKPTIILLHYTVSGTTQSAVDTLCDPQPDDPTKRVSAHVVIGRTGKIVQLVPFNMVAWHAGVSKWNGVSGLNRHAIGFEIVNWGFAYQSESTGAIRLKHKNESIERWWQPYTKEQIDAVCYLIRILKASYPIEIVLGHDDVSPGRKTDPGPALDWRYIRKRIA